MPLFTPPVVYDRPSFLPDSEDRPWEKGLFKYVHPANYYGRCVNVFYLSDGSFVQDVATPGHTKTDVPYPWDPNHPDAPYSSTAFWDVSITPPPYVIETISHTVWIVSVTNRPTQVTTAMAAILTAAGYGGNIT